VVPEVSTTALWSLTTLGRESSWGRSSRPFHSSTLLQMEGLELRL